MMLTIICPVYNRADLLPECVAALMKLPAVLAEVVVVDDCSTDGTEAVCRELSAEYGGDRLRYVRLERNAGAPAARNRGIAEARGDLLMFVDSDDVPVASGIIELVQRLEVRKDLDFLYGKVLVTDASLQPVAGRSPVGGIYADTAAEIGGYHWHTMGPVYRRRLLERVGPWNTELSGSQDWEYQARVKIARARGEFMDVLVGYWRRHGGERVGAKSFRPDYLESVMASAEAVLRHAEKAGRADAALRRRLAKRLLVHAIEWGANGRAPDKRRCCCQAIATASKDAQIAVLGSLLKFTPGCLDRWWCRRLERRRGSR
jgi:glycosyltransferase involved in cell wall biosynthesis